MYSQHCPQLARPCPNNIWPQLYTLIKQRRKANSWEFPSKQLQTSKYLNIWRYTNLIGWSEGLLVASNTHRRLSMKTTYVVDSMYMWLNILWILCHLVFMDICKGCGIPVGNDYPSGHLVPSPFLRLAYAQSIEPRFPELDLSFPDFLHWTSIGSFSILLVQVFVK